MGTVYRKTVTKPLPTGAKIIVRNGQRLAEWKPAEGKSRTAPVTVGKDGTDRLVITVRTWTAKYRDGNDIVQEVPTGCRDKTAAESVLADLERRAERVRGGLLTAAEANAIDHQERPLREHIDAYLLKLEAEGTSPAHRANVRRALLRLAADCQFKRLGSLAREALERWLVAQERADMGARTRNTYRAAAVAFCNWCIETGRLLVNPFAKVAKAAEDADTRRQRRALTEDELRRLLDVAQRRPLEDRLTVYKGPRKGQRYAKLRPEVQRRLERLGQERALIYKTLVLTGLRRGELASLTVGQVVLDSDPPYLVLEAADEKNREGSTIPLRADLAADLRDWLAEKAAPPEATASRQTLPFASLAGLVARGSLVTVPAATPLFDVPDKLVRILDRDLLAAGIARRVKGPDGKVRIDKRDERGRTVDVHALRHTFGTLLSKGGVTPRTAQAAMRHSKVDLTMNVYTDPKLLDVAGAVQSLPNLPLGNGREIQANALSATGTDESMDSAFAPGFAPTGGKPRILQALDGKTASKTDKKLDGGPFAVRSTPVNTKGPLSIAVSEPLAVGASGLEPPTPSLSSWCSNQLS